MAAFHIHASRNRVATPFMGLSALLGVLVAGPAPAADLPPLPGFTVLETDVVDGVPQAHVSYVSDGLAVRAFLFFPQGDGPHPLVVFNHGGVSGISTDMKIRSRDLARRGYAVATPTYRGEGGSEGRIEVAHGEVNDVLTVTHLMTALPQVDAGRAAIIGSSHGALISVLAAAREPATYGAAVAACGVMDVEVWYHWLVEHDFDVSDSLTVAIYGQGPNDRPQAFEARKGVLAAPHIGIPVLLQYGLKDRTVPVEQGRLMLDALHAAGRDDAAFWTYPHLGHAFWFWNDLRYHPQEDLDEAEASWRDMIRFLTTHLKTGN